MFAFHYSLHVFEALAIFQIQTPQSRLVLSPHVIPQLIKPAPGRGHYDAREDQRQDLKMDDNDICVSEETMG